MHKSETGKLPKVVYKYFNWSDIGSMRILMERELYFCNASRWGNYGEFDFVFKEIDGIFLKGEMESAIEKMRNENPTLYERWVNIHMYIYKLDLNKINTLTSDERDLYETQIVDTIIEKRVKDIVENKEAYKNSMKKFFYKRTGIFSTSLSKKSLPLWEWKKTYNRVINNNAICLGLDLEKIRQKLDDIGNYTLGYVKYEKHLNEIDFVGSGVTFLINRFNSITYTLPTDLVNQIVDQKELRILKFLTNNTSKKSKERFLQLGNDFITEIIIHFDATEDIKNEIAQIAQSIGCLNVSYYKQ